MLSRQETLQSKILTSVLIEDLGSEQSYCSSSHSLRHSNCRQHQRDGHVAATERSNTASLQVIMELRQGKNQQGNVSSPAKDFQGARRQDTDSFSGKSISAGNRANARGGGESCTAPAWVGKQGRSEERHQLSAPLQV